MDTAEISKALNRGKHTTRYTKLFFVENGWLADTPGFGMVEFFDMDEVSLSHSFIEFFTFLNLVNIVVVFIKMNLLVM